MRTLQGQCQPMAMGTNSVPTGSPRLGRSEEGTLFGANSSVLMQRGFEDRKVGVSSIVTQPGCDSSKAGRQLGPGALEAGRAVDRLLRSGCWSAPCAAPLWCCSIGAAQRRAGL